MWSLLSSHSGQLKRAFEFVFSFSCKVNCLACHSFPKGNILDGALSECSPAIALFACHSSAQSWALKLFRSQRFMGMWGNRWIHTQALVTAREFIPFFYFFKRPKHSWLTVFRHWIHLPLHSMTENSEREGGIGSWTFWKGLGDVLMQKGASSTRTRYLTCGQGFPCVS